MARCFSSTTIPPRSTAAISGRRSAATSSARRICYGRVEIAARGDGARRGRAGPCRSGGSLAITHRRGFRPLRCAASLDRAGHARRKPRAHDARRTRSEEHTSELQSLMRISYAVFCLKKKKQKDSDKDQHTTHSILPLNEHI